VLFLEGEEEPAEIGTMKRKLTDMAADMEQSGEWLEKAMEQAWQVAGALAGYPELADLLGERHRIISNDWQSAQLQGLVGRLVRRALDLVAKVDFSPAALRADLAGERRAADYLYSASELLDRAADLTAESGMLVHDNERRWRVFRGRVEDLLGAA
jgi:ABC-type transporter Mla subunit MlaD